MYRRTDGEPVFVQADSPTGEELPALLHKIVTCLMKPLTRRGVLIAEHEQGGSSYLVPRPRLHLIRFLGVLAPNAKWRAMVVPQGPERVASLQAAVIARILTHLGLPARAPPRALARGGFAQAD